MLVNGMYTQSLGDVADFGALYGCGCESSSNVAAQGGLLNGIPNWFLIGALVVGGLIALKKR